MSLAGFRDSGKYGVALLYKCGICVFNEICIDLFKC